MLPPGPNLLLLYALIAVLGLVVLVAHFKLNAFLALVLASLFVGVCSGMDLATVAKSFQDGVGATLGFVAVVVGLGTMLGKMLAESGGAEVVARAFVQWFGQSRIHWTLVFVSFIIGLPVFFAVGLVLLVPILFALAKETKSPLLLLGIPVAAGLSASHTLVPPHPGPMIAIATLHADVGKTILYGIIVGVPAAILAGPIFGSFISRRVIAGDTAIVARTTAAPTPPGVAITLFTILLPVLLMVSTTVADLRLPADHILRKWADFLGAPLTAMLIALLFSFWSFGKRCGFNRSQILKFTEDCLAPASSSSSARVAVSAVCWPIAARAKPLRTSRKISTSRLSCSAGSSPHSSGSPSAAPPSPSAWRRDSSRRSQPPLPAQTSSSSSSPWAQDRSCFRT